jgi:hypothetical protein
MMIWLHALTQPRLAWLVIRFGLWLLWRCTSTEFVAVFLFMVSWVGLAYLAYSWAQKKGPALPPPLRRYRSGRCWFGGYFIEPRPPKLLHRVVGFQNRLNRKWRARLPRLASERIRG